MTTNWLTVKEAAERARVSVSLVYEWVDEGRLPHIRIGKSGARGSVRVGAEVLEVFLRKDGRIVKPAKKVVTQEIVDAIVSQLSGSPLVLTKYKPHLWWECDVFEITKDGHFNEFEVKVSLQNYRTDRHKGPEAWQMEGGDPSCQHLFVNNQCTKCLAQLNRVVLLESKHQLMDSGSHRSPQRFSYVVPRGMVQPASVPEHAGLIYFDSGKLMVMKSAPRLHRHKPDPKVKRNAEGYVQWLVGKKIAQGTASEEEVKSHRRHMLETMERISGNRVEG